MLFGPTGCAMTPTHTRRGGKLYRYYVSQTVLKNGADACPINRVPAGDIEAAVVAQVRRLLVEPEIVVATWRAVRVTEGGVTEAAVRDALHAFEPLWGELFPAEQARIVQLLVERVEVGVDGLDIRLRVEGLASSGPGSAGAGVAGGGVITKAKPVSGALAGAERAASATSLDG